MQLLFMFWMFLGLELHGCVQRQYLFAKVMFRGIYWLQHSQWINLGQCEAQNSHMPLFSECRIYFQFLGRAQHSTLLTCDLIFHFNPPCLLNFFFVFSFDISAALLIVSSSVGNPSPYINVFYASPKWMRGWGELGEIWPLQLRGV